LLSLPICGKYRKDSKKPAETAGRKKRQRVANKTLLVVVQVYDEERDIFMRQAVVNFLDHNGRKFIAKTAWWAMHSNYTVTTFPVSDGEAAEYPEVDRRKE